ncbi:MAG: heat shock protein GrpE [Syntrophorhabdaceae bacterium PtaU1.Bin034]|jgi:molecular chaperone GrpE|nr:MAG: heat shock protein GrpE [Syntrophorhabdaceae bacterium PtaU1.Bin034]
MHEEIGNGDGISPWKDEILANCREWIEDIRSETELPAVDQDGQAPDLYSFYQELCVLRSEFRKNARRSHEVFSRFGESLDGFQDTVGSLTKRLDLLSEERTSAEILAHQGLFLRLVELHERLRRVGDELQKTTPVHRHGPASRTDRTIISGAIKRLLRSKEKGPAEDDEPLQAAIEGFSLVLSHFEELLNHEGVSRIESLGKRFDPSLMVAVGVVETDVMDPDTVCEEIEGGYTHEGRVLKFAKVTVAKEKERQ